MKLQYCCPACQQMNKVQVEPVTETLSCTHCSWSRSVEGHNDTGAPEECLVCGCGDLWRQKDFPQRLGLLMVAAGATLSTIAWANYQPVLALGILMGFALVDLLLYTFMGDVLVCYRCHSRYRPETIAEDHPRFDLEVAERYRQQELRLKETRH